MEYPFLLFIVFSFVFIGLFLFVSLFVSQLKKMRAHFKWSQSIIYLLGLLLILVSLTLSYFVYFYFSLSLALLIFLLLNSMAVVLLYRASLIIRKERNTL